MFAERIQHLTPSIIREILASAQNRMSYRLPEACLRKEFSRY